MGTTLTGTTPANTYDSLIKVTDNGPLSATAKYLSDGLGNDSVLALSTSNVGIGTNNPSVTLSVVGPSGSPNVLSLSGANSNCDIIMQSASTSSPTRLRNATNDFQIHTLGSERMRITSGGDVGIGTDSPTRKLDVLQSDTGAVAGQFKNSTTAASGVTGYGLIVESEASAASSYNAIFRDLAGSQTYMVIKTETAQDGYVGINTFNPAVHLDVVGQIRANTGILFGSDTAAANSLDDYEEGTFTPSITFGGGSTGIGYNFQGGRYVKIGRQVFITGSINLSNKGSSTGAAVIGGLPFTVFNDISAYSAPALRFNGVSFTGQYSGFVSLNSTNLNLNQTSEAGTVSDITDANFVNSGGDVIIFELSYPVS